MTTRRLRFLSVIVPVLFVAVALARYGALVWHDFIAVHLPNPDSYYNVVLLLDSWRQGLFPFEPRDGAPFGSWVHWTLPYSWSLWQAHWPFIWMGFDSARALVYGGGALTTVSALLLALCVAIAVLKVGSRRAAMVSGLVLATSLPVLNYARLDQITHHIFMLVPLALAAACVLGTRERDTARDVFAGLLLGLGFWVSPEVMPFAVGLFYLRIAARIQFPASAAVWPVACGLVAMVGFAMWLDPPPPTFSPWEPTRLSLAWVVFAGLLAIVGLTADRISTSRLRLLPAALLIAVLSLLLGGAWLAFTPELVGGVTGSVPAELKRVWWAQISELQPVTTAAEWASWVVPPLAAAAIAAVVAWRKRLLWLGGLAFMALCYAGLSAWHTRMGAAGSLAGVLALCVAAGQLHAFSDDDAGLSKREQVFGLAVTLLPVVCLFSAFGFAALFAQNKPQRKCNIAPIAAALNEIPSTTILTGVFEGPELLYRTHHRTIAGPYHHNVPGMLDDYNAWLDTGDATAWAIIERRRVGYVLACNDVEKSLSAIHGKPTLALRLAKGDSPGWLKLEPWPQGVHANFKLYRVVPPDTGMTQR